MVLCFWPCQSVPSWNHFGGYARKRSPCNGCKMGRFFPSSGLSVLHGYTPQKGYGTLAPEPLQGCHSTGASVARRRYDNSFRDKDLGLRSDTSDTSDACSRKMQML